MVTGTLLKSPLPDEVPKLESHQHGFSDPIQHFGSALNINIRVQALFPNVVYVPMSGPSVALWSLTVLGRKHAFSLQPAVIFGRTE